MPQIRDKLPDTVFGRYKTLKLTWVIGLVPAKKTEMVSARSLRQRKPRKTSEIAKLKSQVDRLEEFSRRDNLRMYGCLTAET